MKQPNSKTCGQTTVAMLTNVPIESIIKIYGHESTSCVGEAKKALKVLGYRHSQTFKIDNRKHLENQMMLQGTKKFIRIKYGAREIGHFLAMDTDGKVYDTNKKVYNDVYEMLDDYNQIWKKRDGRNVHVSHYFEIYE